MKLKTRRVGLIRELEIESAIVPKRRGELYAIAAYRIERLERGLRELLADTQHSEHYCGDKDCPVVLARRILKERPRSKAKGRTRARPSVSTRRP